MGTLYTTSNRLHVNLDSVDQEFDKFAFKRLPRAVFKPSLTSVDERSSVTRALAESLRCARLPAEYSITQTLRDRADPLVG